MRYPALLITIFSFAACTGTAPTEDPSLVGRAEAVINQVPSGVGCVQITAGTRVTNTDTTAGQSVTVQLTRLPVGNVTFSALAFASSCAAVTSASTADWASAPVVANIAVGQVTPVRLLLEPSGSASVGVDFDVDGGTVSPSPSPSCVPSTAQCKLNGQVCGSAPDGCGHTISCGSCGGATCCFDYCAPPHTLCQ